MGNGHLDIGAGIGNASIFNPSPAIQQFGNIVAQQRAQKQADDQALINQASQLKADQIRDADRGDYINKYNDWKQSAINANNLPRNSRDRLDALANSQSKYNDLGNFISESKKEGANEHQLATMRLSQPHMFSEDANGHIIRSMQSPMSHPDFIPGNNYSQLERYVDPDKMEKLYGDFKGNLAKNEQWDNGTYTPATEPGTGRKGAYKVQTQGIPFEGETGSMTHLLHLSTIRPDFKKYVNGLYPDIKGQNDDETNALRLKQFTVDHGDKDGFYNTTRSEFVAAPKPDNYFIHHDYAVSHPIGGGQVPSQPQSMNIPFSGKAGVVSNSPNYVPVSLSKKNFAGAQGIDMSTGKPESPLNSSDDYSIVGAGDFPIIKHGVTNNPKLNGTLAQPDFVHQNPNAVEYKRMVHVQQKDAAGNNYDHLIPYENLPKNVANQKDVKQALAGFNKTPVYGKQKAKSDPLGLGL